ncbi:lipocalin-like domain-containing protein [Streptomyces sp. B6B3]|uniref:lipocalin-like domain-containing protein n=1 Tax=Streptomyces sp. B6B3 TaxID=3153570 RepID=UPI00325D2F28
MTAATSAGAASSAEPPHADLTPGDLVGTWRLESYLTVGPDGATAEGPLGPAPAGLLLYGADHRMSVSMMRTDDAEPGAEPRAGTRFMGYAGGWRLAGRQVVHTVAVSSHSYLLGTRQVRDCVLDDEVLTLTGSARTADGVRRGVLTWRRADGEPR